VIPRAALTTAATATRADIAVVQQTRLRTEQ
jgi:hypothetical protein